MSETEHKPSVLGEFLAAAEKMSKFIGLVGIIVAAITFSTGNRLPAYISIIVAYAGFAIFFLHVITVKAERDAHLVYKGETIRRREHIYPKSQRLLSGVAFSMLTIATVIWLGVNLWGDYLGTREMKEGYSLLDQPAVTIAPLATAGTQPYARPNSTSSPMFSHENVSVFSCIYGVSTRSGGNVWVIASEPHWIEVGDGSVEIDESAGMVVSALFLAPQPIIVRELFIVIDDSSDPIELPELELYVNPDCLPAGASVEHLTFKTAEIDRTQTGQALVPLEESQSVQLPYRLEAYDALDIAVPVIPTEEGSYTFHLVASVVDYSGDSDEVESQQLTFGFVHFAADDLDQQTISVAIPMP